MRRCGPALIIPPSPGGKLLARTMRELIAASTEIAFAVARVRLSALESIARMIPELERCRLVLAQFTASGLILPHDVIHDRRDGLLQLLEYARSERIEVRSAGASRWEPDFSLFRLRADGDSVCMLGAHHLLPAENDIEWPLTCVLTQRSAVKRAHTHFESVWQSAHDVKPAIVGILEQELCG
jgi:hypothetical protein